MEKGINWFLLIDGLKHYINNGYTYVNAPWDVMQDISAITKPIDKDDFPLRDGQVLVGSAEQSLISIMKGAANPEYDIPFDTNIVTVTPCFRNEPVLDELHQLYFMKVELFRCWMWMDKHNKGEMAKQYTEQLLSDALDFYNKYIPCQVLKINDNTFDIVDKKNNIELGTYTSYTHGYHEWVCGTGVAEPRLSTVINKQKTPGLTGVFCYQINTI
jgi:seryl-tRNA synthetase